MIYLQTGLPGHGKTLYTIAFVKELSEKENRPVFYSGIKDLALPWHEIDAEKWMDAPDGAIIVIDECQAIFRVRGRGAVVPDYVSALETHRHKGVDIFLITQHPMLMDSHVRRLIERHSHISRRFGMQRSTILQFESCKADPLANIAGAQRLEWSFPKEVFSYYKSAEVHTVKRRLPMAWYLMFIVPALVIALIWYFVQRHYQDGKYIIPGVDLEKSAEVSKTEKKPDSPGRTPDKVKPLTTAEYVAAYHPRLEGLAYTAPVYDEVTKPQEAPIPAACVSSKSKGCQCYSQQGTKLEMPREMCLQIVSNGFFQAFGNRGKADPQPVKEKPVQVAQNEVVTGSLMPPTPPQSITASVPAGNTSTNPRLNPAMRETK